LELLRGVKAPLYGIPGNHDYWAKVDFGVIAKAFEATGGAWLTDGRVLTRDRKVNLIGLTCNHDPQDVAPAPGVKNIMLIHYPSYVKKLSAWKYDAILAGHSHGGQVRLPFIGALVTPTRVDGYELGLYQTEAGPLYVNPGIGYFYLNIRFRCRPELTLIEV